MKNNPSLKSKGFNVNASIENPEKIKFNIKT